MNSFVLHTTRCPISGEQGDTTEIYPANFDATSFSPTVFSARRLPDRVHYRIVRSNRSGLVRSDPIAAPELMHDLYRRSSFDYEEEIAALRRTYGRYLTRVCALGCEGGRLLEIGCGNGFFLELAQRSGFRDVHGIEPSRRAVERAKPDIRQRIICEVMRPGIFEAQQFDLICMFQVFDHIADPNELLGECLRLLNPKGFILTLNHNIESWSAQLLGERSPIIDIEHTYLYSPSTLERIFSLNGFDIVEQGTVINTYSLRYIFRLVPCPRPIKFLGLHALRTLGLGHVLLTLPLGNMYLIAQKPKTQRP